jgi:hypothetical protein
VLPFAAGSQRQSEKSPLSPSEVSRQIGGLSIPKESQRGEEPSQEALAAALLPKAGRAPTTAPADLSALGTNTPAMKAAVMFAKRKLRSCGAKIAVPIVPVPANANSQFFSICSGQSRDCDRGKNES